MRPVLLFAALVCGSVAACSTPATPPTPPTAERPTEPKTPETSPSPSSNGSACPCAAPYECRTVVGRQPESARDECWIPCVGDDQRCPDGMTCQMIFDGPGHVCRPNRAD